MLPLSTTRAEWLQEPTLLGPREKRYALNFTSYNKCIVASYWAMPLLSMVTARSKTMEIKLGMEKLGEEHMHWEEEKPTKTLMSLQAVIVCDEKTVRILFGNKILMIQGDRNDGSSTSRLNIISCTKTRKYIQKGCHVFLAYITEKKTEKKSEEKRLEDVPIMRDFF
ncbi:hypothetical protein Tco_0945870 [Tanacetum coccineum]